ncbi:MAG: hypothetical protein ACD_26C00034G0049 [uncultured bacterium]|nr:MAG: hypothetical protein ACD_26C00034G0049 [uncultured bacterium]
MNKKVFKLKFCRLCKGKNIIAVLDLGKTALANSFLKKNQLSSKELFFPLGLNFCPNCGQLQTSHVVNPELMFRNYVWVSSTSSVTRDHFIEYAKTAFTKLKMKKGDFVVEMGSNDGVLLKPFKELGAKVLGIDPARNVARRTTLGGIETLPYFFDSKIAKKVAKKYGKAKLISGNNVFAHIHDLDEIVNGVKFLLDKNGVFVIEFPYLMDFVEKNLFDLVYHEHLSYLAIAPLSLFFKKHGMEIFDILKTPVHGGSVRLFVQKIGDDYKIGKSVKKFIEFEKKKKLDVLQTYVDYSKSIEDNKKKLINILTDIKKDGKKIIAFGAPAKGNTLLTYFNITTNILDYIVDDSEYKHNLYTPGTHIPIYSPDRLKVDKPDYVFMLAWNFADDLMKRLKEFKKNGGKFIIPVPKPHII